MHYSTLRDLFKHAISTVGAVYFRTCGKAIKKGGIERDEKGTALNCWKYFGISIEKLKNHIEDICLVGNRISLGNRYESIVHRY
jgi:hypothetical protein